MFKVFCTTFCSVFLCLLSSVSYGVELEIKDSIVRIPATATLVQLGELKQQASIQDLQDELNTKPLALNNIAKQWVTRETLSQLLTEQLGHTIAVTGVEKVWLELCQTLDIDLLNQSFDRAFKQHFDSGIANFQAVSLLHKNTCLPAEVDNVSIDRDNLLKTRQQVVLELVSGAKLMVWLEVKAELAVAKLKQQKPVNAKIKASDVDWYMSSTDELNVSHLHPISSSLPTRLYSKKRLAAGDLVSTRNTYIKPMVSRGESVKVVYQSGAVKVEFTGTALANANQGEQVQVVFDNATKPVITHVVSEGVVGV